MRDRKKVKTTVLLAFLALSMFLAVVTMECAAAPAITLNPTAQAPGASVSVSGSDFGATKAVGICCGAEAAVVNELCPTATGSGAGPWTSRLAYAPIKPGSFQLQSDVEGVIVQYTDNGDGTLSSTSTYFVSGTINYVTGVFSRTSTTDLSSYTIIHTANYTRYQHNVTSAGGVTTNAAGAFTCSITVPSMPNGVYSITAISTQGNRAVASLGVDSSIPEGFTIGAMLMLSSVALIVGSHYLRKQSKPTMFVR